MMCTKGGGGVQCAHLGGGGGGGGVDMGALNGLTLVPAAHDVQLTTKQQLGLHHLVPIHRACRPVYQTPATEPARQRKMGEGLVTGWYQDASVVRHAIGKRLALYDQSCEGWRRSWGGSGFVNRCEVWPQASEVKGGGGA